MQAQGPGRRGLVAAAALDHLFDDVPLDLAQLPAQEHRGGVGAARSGLCGPQAIAALPIVRAVGHRHGVRDDAGQLGQVARPIVVQQALPRLLGKAPGGLLRVDALCGKGLPQVVFHQRLDVLPALAQGRNPNGGNVQQVVEAAVEAAFGHGRLQIAGGGSDQPHVRRSRLRTRKAIDITPEKHVEQADLGPQRQALDVERKRVPPRADSSSPGQSGWPSSTPCGWRPKRVGLQLRLVESPCRRRGPGGGRRGGFAGGSPGPPGPFSCRVRRGGGRGRRWGRSWPRRPAPPASPDSRRPAGRRSPRSPAAGSGAGRRRRVRRGAATGAARTPTPGPAIFEWPPAVNGFVR